MKQHIKSVILSGTKWSRRISILSLFAFIACTDYVQDIEDQRDEWREEQASLLLSSEEQDVSSSSTTNKESSSSSISGKSSSSIGSDSTDVKDSSSSSSTSGKSSSSEEKGVSSSSEISSSSVTSSSSAVTSSSTSEIATTSSSNIIQTSSSAKESWAYLNPAISYGEMVDNRDGQVYKTVVIGKQEWMAENLNYKYSFGTFCYQQQDSNCIKFGRLYTWAAAMDSVGSFSLKGKNCGYYTQCTPTYPVQGVCPNNWHLPTIDEWKELFEFESINYVAKFLKSATANWRGQWGSTNSSGFSAVPSGGLDYRNQNMGDDAFFFFFIISQEDTYSNSFYTFILSDQQSANYDNSSSRMSAFSIRCLKDHSNSNAVSSSSESAESSSSLNTTAEPCKTAEEDNCEYGTLEDSRDGQTYKTVKIGSQWWMAENLNFETENSYCYNDSTSNCDKFGKLYIWEVAVSACPTNWHLPTPADFKILIDAVGDTSNAGLRLKSTDGWKNNGNGSNDFGFTALPAGQGFAGNLNHIVSFDRKGDGAIFWGFSENSAQKVYYATFNTDLDEILFSYDSRLFAFSVRCIKD